MVVFFRVSTAPVDARAVLAILAETNLQRLVNASAADARRCLNASCTFSGYGPERFRLGVVIAAFTQHQRDVVCDFNPSLLRFAASA